MLLLFFQPYCTNSTISEYIDFSPSFNSYPAFIKDGMFPVAVDELCIELELVKLVEPGVEICHLRYRLEYDVAVGLERTSQLNCSLTILVQAQEAQLDVDWSTRDPVSSWFLIRTNEPC